MTRLMNNMSEARHSACQKPHKYKKLVYSLCWFHSVLAALTPTPTLTSILTLTPTLALTPTPTLTSILTPTPTLTLILILPQILTLTLTLTLTPTLILTLCRRR